MLFRSQLETGEKVVGGSTTLNGTVIFGTNIPATEVADSCSSLGEARLYAVNYKTGQPSFNGNLDDVVGVEDRFAFGGVDLSDQPGHQWASSVMDRPPGAVLPGLASRARKAASSAQTAMKAKASPKARIWAFCAIM